jgi:MbtH protein
MSDEHSDWQDEPVQVVRNERGDWSIWPADRDPPAGWQSVGVTGEKAHCLEYIERQATEPNPDDAET